MSDCCRDYRSMSRVLAFVTLAAFAYVVGIWLLDFAATTSMRNGAWLAFGVAMLALEARGFHRLMKRTRGKCMCGEPLRKRGCACS